MWDNFIGRHIRRGTRNLFIWNSLILLGLAVAGYFTSRYYYNFFLGPFKVDAAEWSNLQNPDERLEYYVEVASDQVVETDIIHKKDRRRRGRKIGEEVVSRDLLFAVGDTALVVEYDPNDPVKNRVGGKLEPLARPELYLKHSQTFNAKHVAPVKVDATGFRLRGWIGLAVMSPLGLLAVFNIYRGVKRWNDPSGHPLAKQLERYGDPAEVCAKIESEWESDDKEAVGPVAVTRMWLIHPHTFGMTLVHLGEAVWVYKSATRHYHNGIPTGTTYTDVLCDNRGNQHSFTLKNEGLCDQFVIAVAHRVPWILTGYDEDLEQMWKKDKERVYQLLEERRQEFAAHLREAQGSDDEEPDQVQEVEPA